MSLWDIVGNFSILVIVLSIILTVFGLVSGETRQEKSDRIRIPNITFQLGLMGLGLSLAASPLPGENHNPDIIAGALMMLLGITGLTFFMLRSRRRSR